MMIFSIATVVGLNRYKILSLSDPIKTDVILENMNDIVLHISMDLKIIYMNTFAEDMLGFQILKNEEILMDILFGEQTNELKYLKKEIIDCVNKGEDFKSDS